MLKLLITDFDGTLVDTFETNLLAYQQTFAEVSLTLTAEEYYRCYSLRFDAFMQVMGMSDKKTVTKIKEAKVAVYPQHFDVLRVNKALTQLLLTGGKIAVASTAREKNLIAALKHIDMADCWDYIVAGEQVPVGKLDSFIHIHILQHFGISVNEAMEKVLKYLHTFWIQLFAYTQEGPYTIDNSIVERFIRPLAGERKNSLSFGSGKMARVSAAYHTIISTCQMQGVSALQYFKMFFQAIVNGRKDYENLLPMTSGLNNKTLKINFFFELI